MQLSFPTWQAVLDAPRSAFFRGHTSDTVFDRSIAGPLTPYMEALFTQSNARVLIGQAANGVFRFIALPTQVYPAPTSEGELGLGPGMYYHFDVAMYAGDLSYRIFLDSAESVNLAAEDRDNETFYADHFLPMTRTCIGDLDVTLISLTPVAPDARSAALTPAPLPGPAGAIYVLRLYNVGSTLIQGKIVLQAGDLLVGHYEDAIPAMSALKHPNVDLRQQTLILSRPEGSVGIHLHQGRWTRMEPPFEAERIFHLAPQEEEIVEAYVAIGRTYGDVMPIIYELHMRPALDWLNLTANFWHSRLGQLTVDADDANEEAQVSRDIYIRCLLDNFNCLQTDAEGNLIAHWQGAPSHGYGTIWGIDLEPTAVSVAQVCPELARQVLLFFMARSRVPRGAPDHSVPILVAPIIIARKYLETTGDVTFFEQRPDVMVALQGIMSELMALQAPDEVLFPSRYSSDGPVGRRYDYGTNVKVWYAFSSFAYLLRQLGRLGEAERYSQIAQGIAQAIEQTMIISGPFGRQISGGTNLSEDPGTFYLPEGVPYYDGEDTSSMLAPIYGISDFTYEPWVNYHRFARSLWCPNFDPEFEALRWSPGEFGVLDGTAFVSRLGGSLTRTEMLEAMQILHKVATDDATGSIFWWPRGLDYKRGLTRCSQGQGAWAWQYLQQWLGLHVDAPARVLTLAPRGLLSRIDWEGFTSGRHRFDVHWAENELGVIARIKNHTEETWVIQCGFRQPGTGAEASLSWQTVRVEPGCEVTLTHQASAALATKGMDRAAIAREEATILGDADGVLFVRFGPATLWGHWDTHLWWDQTAMPLAVRFVIVNGTRQDWARVSVELSYPEGWLAQGRQPQMWTRPEQMVSRAARVELGPLPRLARAVAPFWMKGPYTFNLGKSWESSTKPFHAVSQPGNELTLPSPDVNAPEEITFIAELRATAVDGSEIYRCLQVPVRIVPSGK